MIVRGFKSFAERTEIEFADGVTAIVGPNGSGKSNIADAVRWALGEQNVRQLRGEQAADIIFAGTETQRAKAAAEVTLVFDNADGFLEPESAEVSVTRRLLRSGDSEFYINKRACRLKDIHMLFADTGLGKDSMAVIGQNRVDRILVGKPEERKLIFEEVAGISRFKLRKAEGVRKLAEAQRNMTRVEDIANVLAEELGPLEERAGRTRSYFELETQLKSIEATLAWQKWRSTQRQLTRVENEHIEKQAQATAAQTALLQAEGQRQQRLQSMEKENLQLRALEQAAAAAEQEKEKWSGEYRIIEESQRHLETRLAEREEQKKNYAQQIQTWQVESQKWQSDLQEYTKQSELWQEKLARAEEELVVLEAAQAEFVERQRTRDRAEAERKAEYAGIEQRLQEGAAEQVSRQEMAQVLQERMAREKGEQQALEERAAVDRADYDLLQEAQAQRKATIAEKEAARKELRQRQEMQWEAQRRRENELQVLRERCQYLERLAAEHEGFNRSTKAVLQAKEGWRQGCLGTVADILDVPERYLTAIDIALGGTLQNVVVRDMNIAEQAVRYLQRNQAGRVTFYPLDTIQPRGLSVDDSRALRELGVIGSADTCVQYDGKYRNLVSYLLGRTLIVQDMETARRLTKSYQRRLRMVTLDGQLFQPGGSISGGSTRRAENTAFGRKHEILQLHQQIAELESMKDEIPDSTSELDHEIARLEEEWQRAEIRSAEIYTRLTEYRTRIEEKERLVANSVAEWEKTQQRIAEWNDLQVSLEQRLRDIGTPLPEVEALSAEVAGLKEKQAQRTELRVQETEIRLHLEKASEMVRNLAEQCRNAENELQDLTSKAEEERGRLTELVDKRQKAEDAFATAQEMSQLKRREAEEFYQHREEQFQRDRASEEEYEALRKAERDCQVAMAGAAAKVEQARQELTLRAEELAATGYTVESVQEVLCEGNMAEVKALHKEVEGKMAALGPINPNAIEEYDEAREKHQFYQQQLADMNQAARELQDVIKEIDRHMTQQFREAFTVVAAEFQRIFTHLFGGGTAKLEITEGDENQVGGVEIYIQPPGKKRQPLTLLSGGERALTVIALLFSFMAYRPAPFCLVDEVDAALDDANVDRFRRYLKEGRGDMQFIVITHRKLTMEAADRLQGVTMEEKGISRMIGVDLEQYREE